MPNLEVLADRLIHILPADGSQMPNDEARLLLGRAVETPVEGETYFSVIALLAPARRTLRDQSAGEASMVCSKWNLHSPDWNFTQEAAADLRCHIRGDDFCAQGMNGLADPLG